MKKAIILLLAALLLTACANSTDPENNQNPDAASTEISTDSEAAEEAPAGEPELTPPAVEDMGGAVLTILNYTPEAFNWANTLIFAEELNGEILNDAVLTREQKVEENYNCSLEELATGDVQGTINTSVAAGDSTFDTAMLFDANVSNQLVSGNLLSWDSLSLDLTSPWWDGAATEQYNFYGIQAAVSGAFSLYNYSTRHCYVFNSDLLEAIAPGTDLYTLVREGKWTVDELYRYGEMAVLDLNGDGVMDTDNDQWGVVSSVTRHYSAMLAGAGVKYIDRDEAGTLCFTIPNSEPAQNVISKLVQLNEGNNIYTSGTNDIGGGAESPVFYNNRALFIAAYVGEAARMRDIDFGIGIVPSPKFTEDQPQYYSLVEGGAQSILPKTLTGEDLHKAAVLLDAFGYYSFVESVPAYIDQVLYMKVARNEDSTEMLRIVFDTSFYDLGTGVWSAETKNQFTQNIFLPRSDTVSSLCAKIQKVLDKTLERFTDSVKEMQ